MESRRTSAQVCFLVHKWDGIREKSQHFDFLRPLVEEISGIIGIDPWHMICDSFVSEEKCLEKESCRIQLASDVDVFLAHLGERYASLGIEREPVAYVKNNRGTYGLGIMTVTSGEQLLNLSNRKMKKLMYGKGSLETEDFLIQRCSDIDENTVGSTCRACCLPR